MPEENKIRVIIADDHPLVREGIRTLLGSVNEIRIVGEASNGNDLLNLLDVTDCDLLLLDLNMPGKSGLDVIKIVRQKFPKILILVLSMFPLTRFAVRALKAGAVGYVTKDSASEELLKAIRTIMLRGKYISLELAEMLAEEFGNHKKAMPHETLSDREFQIMGLLTSGKSIREIAEELCLNISTVNTYHVRILEKMNMKSNVELTLYAVEHNLIEF